MPSIWDVINSASSVEQPMLNVHTVHHFCHKKIQTTFLIWKSACGEPFIVSQEPTPITNQLTHSKYLGLSFALHPVSQYWFHLVTDADETSMMTGVCI